MSVPSPSQSWVRYRVERARAGWELSGETMPESLLHDEVVTLLRAILAAWAAEHRPCLVARNLAIRWDESRPQVGVDPDVAVLGSPPPEGDSLRSVRTWDTGHQAPLLAIEVVSETNPRKDYVVAPDKYAASGTQELWIFDPLLSGPDSHGGPFRLQVWGRDERGDFVRTYAGDGPAFSAGLDAYLVVVDEGRKLRLARDASGTDFWLTGEEAERVAKEAERAAKEAERVAKEAERVAKEAERAAKEAERAAKETERAAKEEALARVRALEAQLAARRPGE